MSELFFKVLLIENWLKILNFNGVADLTDVFDIFIQKLGSKSSTHKKNGC